MQPNAKGVFRTAALFVACAFWALAMTSATREAAAQEPAPPERLVKLGLIAPLSGDFAGLGQQAQAAAEFALEHVVQARGARIILVVRDSQGQGEAAAAAVRELAQDPDILAILGPLGRKETLAAAQAAHEAGIPLLSLSSSRDAHEHSPWSFRARIAPEEQAEQLARAAIREMGLKRAAILHADNEYAKGAAQAFSEAFAALGGEVVATTYYLPETSNFSGPLDVLVKRRVRVDKPVVQPPPGKPPKETYAPSGQEAEMNFDLLFIPDFHSRISRILPFLNDAGIDTGEVGTGSGVQLLGLSGWQGESMRLTGALAQGALFTDLFAGLEDVDRAEGFAQMFRTHVQREAVDLDAEIADTLALTVDVALSLPAQSPTIAERRQLMRTQLAGGRALEGVCGPLRFRPDGSPVRTVRLFRFDVGGAVAPWTPPKTVIPGN